MKRFDGTGTTGAAVWSVPCAPGGEGREGICIPSYDIIPSTASGNFE